MGKTNNTQKQLNYVFRIQKMANRKMLIKKSCRKCGVVVMIERGKYGNPKSPLCSKCKVNPHKEIIKLKEKQNVLC